MIPFSQLDVRWKNLRLGYTGGMTIGQAGCYMTCFSMLVGKSPIVVNSLLISKGGYVNGNLINSALTAKIIGLQYNGQTKENPGNICIAETNAHAPLYPTHFFVVFPDDTIWDPLDLNPTRKPNTYADDTIISYRLVAPLIPYIMSESDPPIPDWAIPTVQKMHEKGITTDPNANNLPIYQVLAIVDKYNS